MDEDVSEKFNSFVDSDSEELMSKDSLDGTRMRVLKGAYEDTVSKLVSENKSLKQQLIRLQDERKDIEENHDQLIAEAAQKLVDKTDTKKLMSYYEAFVQLDKENYVLKLSLQEMCEKLGKYEEGDVARKSSSKLDELMKNTTSYYDCNDMEGAALKPLSQNVLNQKEDELKELKMEIEQLRSENETFRSVKIYMEEKKGKRASSIAPNTKITNQQIDELNENVNHLEMEKSLLSKKLSSIEASLTRWIFRACDYKTDLQQARHERDLIKADNAALNEEKLKFNEQMAELEKKLKEVCEKYESEKSLRVKVKSQQSALEADLEHSKQTIKVLNERIEKLNGEIKNLASRNETIRNECEKSMNERIEGLNKQIQSLNAANQKLDTDKNRLDKDNETLKKSLNEIKRKIEQNEHENGDLKAKITKYDNEVGNIRDLKALSDQLKSENQYFNKKIESLLTENNTIKKKFDVNLLEKNAIKCKFEELVREVSDLKQRNAQLEALHASRTQPTHNAQTQHTTPTHTSFAQTDDFNYEALLKPIEQKYEQEINDFIYQEQLYKKEIEQLKHKLSKHDTQFVQLNQNLEEEYKVNMDIRERNEFLFEKCSKIKNDLEAQANEFLKFKLSYEIEKEVLETTINQQKKFIDYIVTTHPELGKKYKLFASKKLN